MINLPQAPRLYDPRDQQNLRTALTQADAQNLKKNTDIEMGRSRFKMQSPNGTRWTIGVTDSGQVGTGGSGPVPTLTHNHIFVGNASNLAGDVALSGDASITDTGVISVTKTGGVTFGYFATGTDASHLTGTLNIAQLPALADAKIWIGNGSSAATAQTVSGDGTLADTGALSVTKTGGVTFGYFATGTDAANLTGTINNARLSAIPNSALANSAVTLNGHGLSLGGSLSLIANDIWANWSTSSGTVTQQQTGGTVSSYVLSGEGTVSYIAQRFSANANGTQFSSRKARGNAASPAVCLSGDFVFQMIGSAYGGTAFQNATNITGSIIETTPSDTAMGGRLAFSVSPLGSVSPSEIMRLEAGTGLSMFGANPVIDQNRTHILNSSTVAGLPSVVTGGLRFVTDLNGGQGVVFGGASNWRDINDGQVAQNTIDGSGVLSKFTGHCDFAYRSIVQNTMQKLKDAGLLTKLVAFGFTAGVPNAADALLNWATPGSNPLVNAGGLAWTATTGITGDGVHALTMANSLTTLGATQNSVSAGVYVLSASASAAAVIGMSNATTRRFYMQSRSSGAIVTRLNDQNDDSWTPAAYTGLFVMSRSLSTGYNDSRNDDAATAIVRTSVAQNATPAFLGTLDTTGNEFCTAAIGFWFVANVGLSTTDIANLRWIVRDNYLVQVGAIPADYVFSALPLATTPPKGTKLYITDGAAAPTFSAAAAGGGTLYTPVYTDSATWRNGG